MATLVNLKLELEFNKSMGDIIDTLKATALVQFRLFQMKNKPNDYFLKEIESCIRILVTTMNRHPYFVERKGLSSAIVIVTSDEGFLGELNILLVNAGLEVRDSKDDEIIVLGERGAKYLEEMNENFVSFPGISEEINDKDIDTICSYLLKCYHKKFRRILIVYPEFSSLTVQKVKLLQALPYQPISQQPEFNLNGKDMMIEPSLGSVLECLIKLWLGYKLFEIFWSSKQSEYAARVMHLEGSTQELTYLNQRLALSYFRQVHALSDKTIREISASRILLSSYR